MICWSWKILIVIIRKVIILGSSFFSLAWLWGVVPLLYVVVSEIRGYVRQKNIIRRLERIEECLKKI